MIEIAPDGQPFVLDRSADIAIPLHLGRCQARCRCGTPLQASIHTGDLVGGIAAHLQVVHDVGPASARLVAQQALKEKR